MNKDKLLKSAPSITASLLLIAATATVGWRGYQFWLDYNTTKEIVVKAAPAAQVKQERTVQQLAPLNLFGKNEPVAQKKETEDLPSTNLRLTLRGVAATNLEKGESGGALIEGPDRNTDFFRVGENMPGNATLHSVYANRVVIDRRGSLENLFFPEDSSSGASIETYASVSRDDSSDYSEPAYEEPVYEEPQYQEPEYPEPQYEEPKYEQPDSGGEPVPVVDAPHDDGSQQAISEPAYQEEPTYAIDQPPEEFSEPSSDNSSELSEMDEQRRQEIRDRLQKLREQIRQKNNG
ncbi:hypothetical protein HCH_03938 [Hahella chejuensis KCTC 2396]|uniref:Type II secretion system protein GspC N-terminal domain-containing protein n=1 Tax=Hahella chejuensis (strain KCTC 2396) TaxID=349521 RepID=Q2SFB6_HAHCH|nr:type II secretion system protein N [Hahella chejuensis]ABC30658.1 hypothetical protein HCH_03938 [Hahella chejuensis KCTC 2396]